MAQITAIQVVACAVELEYTFIEVSAATQLPVSAPVTPDPPTWKNWTWSGYKRVSDGRARAVLLQFLGSFAISG